MNTQCYGVGEEEEKHLFCYIPLSEMEETMKIGMLD